MGIKNINLGLFAVIAFFAMMSLARAEAPQPDKFKLSIGSFALARYDSNISLTDPDLGADLQPVTVSHLQRGLTVALGAGSGQVR